MQLFVELIDNPRRELSVVVLVTEIVPVTYCHGN